MASFELSVKTLTSQIVNLVIRNDFRHALPNRLVLLEPYMQPCQQGMCRGQICRTKPISFHAFPIRWFPSDKLVAM